MNSDHSPVEQDKTTSTDQPQGKLRWEAPAVISFKPVTETQGIGFRAGDGINNVS